VERVPITMMGFRCTRCSHEWVPKVDKAPRVCPKCKSPYWDRERIRPSSKHLVTISKVEFTGWPRSLNNI